VLERISLHSLKKSGKTLKNINRTSFSLCLNDWLDIKLYRVRESHEIFTEETASGVKYLINYYIVTFL